MTAIACSLCGAVGRTEVHHVARRRNAETLTVRVCPPCHRDLTAWHRTAGIQDGDRARDRQTRHDAASVAALSAVHVLALLAHSTGDVGRRDGLSAAEPALSLALRWLRPDAPIGSPRWSLLPDYPDRTGSGELPNAARADLLVARR